MKHKLLLLAAACMFAVTASAQWTKPKVTNFEEMALDGTTQYLYNVGVQKFFVGHNEWDTRASIDEYGDPVRVSIADEDEGYYDIGVYPSKYRTNINAWKSLSGKSWNDMWCDGEDGNETYLGVKMWLITKIGDVYKFSNDYFNQEYEFGPTDATLGVGDWVDGIEGNTRLFLYYQHTITVTRHYDDGDEDVDVDCFQGYFYDEWKFVSEDEYTAYAEKMEVYLAAVSLKNAIDDALEKYPALDLSEQLGVYNDTSSDVEALKAAEASISGVIIEYLKNQDVDPENPVDFTSSIQNATFDTINDFTGWSFGEGTKQFGAGGNVAPAAEVWRGSFDGYQDIVGLPEGVYMLSCNGYIRYNDNTTDDWNAYKSGSKTTCKLYLNSPANGTFDVSVKYISEGGSWGSGINGAGNNITVTYTDDEGNQVTDQLFTPNFMTEAVDYFNDGDGTRYHNEVFGAVADGETVRIGVKNTSEADWNIFDDFKLLYFGNKPESYQYWGQRMAATSEVEIEGYYGQPDKDAYDNTVNTLKNATTKEDVLANVKNLSTVAENLQKSMANYAKFVEEYNAALDWLTSAEENHIEGDDVNKLADYLQASAEDWFDGIVEWEFPNGVVNAFLDLENNATVGTLSYEQIEAETQFLRQMKEDAVKNGMVEGSDVTELLVNPKFDGSFDGWTYKEGKLGDHNVECFYQVVDVYQIVNNVQPGIYAITVNAFERPGDNGNYNGTEPSKVFLFMNQFQTPVQNICKDAVSEEDCIDDVNCYRGNLDGAWPYDYDVPGIGWVPNSVTGADIAFKAGRYEQTCYGLVGDDGVMKVGLTSNGETCAWVLWADFRLKFMGKNQEALNSIIEDYILKASEIADPYGVNERNALETAINNASKASNPDDLYDALFVLVDAYDDALASVAKYKEANIAMDDLINAVSDYSFTASSEAKDNANNIVNTYHDGITKNYNYTNAELDEIVKSIKEAISALKLPDLSDASDDNPVDLTELIVNPSYDDNTDDGWEGSTKSHSGFNRQDMNEYYYAAFDHHQTLSGLPAGTYELTLNCFNRTPGNNATQDRQYLENGQKLEQMSAFVYAKVGDQTYAEPFYLVSEGARANEWTLDGGVNDVLSEVDGIHYFTANDMTGAGAAFEEVDEFDEPLSDEQNYLVRVVFTLTETSDVVIGALNTRTDTWAIWDNWTLTYFGKDSEKNDSGDATGIDAVAGGNAVVSEIYTIGGARVATMQRGLNIVKMSDGTFRKIFVK